MSFIVEGEHSHFLATNAELVSSDHSQAAWATKHIVDNPALQWVVAKYAEADNPNRNGQFWTLEGLRMGQPSIAHAPMNIDHKPNYIVGTFVGSEMIYPTSNAVEGATGNPYIEVVGCVWRAYAPQALVDIHRAHEGASLYTSMECVGETVTCASEGGCGETFPYKGPWSETYCACMQERSRIQRINNPHFLAGALILPPNRPGWGGAEVKVIAEFIKEHADEAEKVYAQVSSDSPNLTPAQWEQQMTTLLMAAHKPEKTSHLELAKRVVATRV